MSDSYDGEIPLNSSWVDLTATYGAAANVQTWVQNKGSYNIEISYRSSATQPVGGYVELKPLEFFGGNAAHIWARSLGGNSAVAIGIV